MTPGALDPPDPLAPVRIRHGARLPHWTQRGGIYFVTFRTADSLPAHVSSALRAEREALDAVVTGGAALSPEEARRRRRLFSEKVDRLLDAGQGECLLRRENVARLVTGAMRHFDGERLHLAAWVVMPNHVHAVLQPLDPWSLSAILHSWKSFTATNINRVLRRRGEFWQEETYDHLVRDDDDFRRCMEYVWTNPERSGLNDWPWRGIEGEDGDPMPP